MPWATLVGMITPYVPEGKHGRPPFAMETMLRIHFMQQWFTLSDPAMEESLHDAPLFREFAGLNWDTPLPDETMVLRFRRLLEEHKLCPADPGAGQRAAGSQGLDAARLHGGGRHADRRTQLDQERHPQMTQSMKGNQ